jgi:hypothetical protein
MNLFSVPPEWFNYCIAFVLGFATCLVASMRKQTIQNLQTLNWKTGDLLKFTFGPQENLEGATKGAKPLSSSEEEGVINALLIDWIKRDPSTSTAVADLSRLSSNLKDAGLSEPLALKFIEGDLNYLISNIVIYRELAKRLASCTRGSQLLQQMQLAMYVYCWLYGPQAEYYTRAFDIARRIDAFKARWTLIPGEILESITHAIDINSDPLTKAIDPGLPAVLDDIYDNPAIVDEKRELWDNISSDFGRILAVLDSYKR